MLGVELDRLQVGPLLWRAWALTEECLLVEFVADGSDIGDAEFMEDYHFNQVCLQQFLEIKSFGMMLIGYPLQVYWGLV